MWEVPGLPKGRVLVVDDEEETRQVMERSLSERGFHAVSASSGQEAVRLAASKHLDVIVLDTDMPDMDGLQTCQELRKSTFVPIIVLGARADEPDVVLALGLGADYFLSKPVRTSELAAHVEAAIRRETIYSRRRDEWETIRIKDLELDSAAHELRRNGRLILLSATEFRLLQALARNVGRILTRDQLLDSVWDLKADGIYSRTVDVHIGRIRRKIGDNPASPRYIMTVPGIGYKMLNG